MPQIYHRVDKDVNVEIPESTKNQYSNSNLLNIKNSNSILKEKENTVTVRQVITNLADVIPQDDYLPFYISQYRKLGYKRYLELANKARRGKDPKRLFFWMLKNNEIVN